MHYSYNDIKIRLEHIVEEAGEGFVYTQRYREGELDSGCEYAWQGKPDCVIGHLLVELGVPVEDMGEGKVFDGNTIDYYGPKLDLDYSITFDSKAVDLMNIFQADQDNGIPWGEALRVGIRSVESSKY
jgi:hypothetical protein